MHACILHIEGVEIMEEYTLWRASFEDITSIRAFGILHWKSSSYSAISIASLNSIIACTDIHVTYGY